MINNIYVKNFRSGYKKSVIDPKKKLYCMYRSTSIVLPSSIDLRPQMTNVRNQGQAGACCGFGTDGVIEYFAKKLFPKDEYILSPMFIYSMAKQLDGEPDSEGSQPNVCLSVLQSTGVCLDSTLPYTDQISYPIVFSPSVSMLKEASSFKIKSFAQCLNQNDIKVALNVDGPVVGAVIVCKSFTEPEDGKFIGLPGSVADDSVLGGHCICLCGYDDSLTHTYADGHTSTGFFILRNSWGTSWGMAGYAYLPYDFLTYQFEVCPGQEQNIFEEAWSVVDIVEPIPDESKVEIIEMWVGSPIALVNHIAQTIDQSVVLDVTTGRTLAPVRFIFEAAGYTVTWNTTTKTVIAVNGSNIIIMVVGNATVTVNGVTQTIDQPLELNVQTGRVLAPVRFVFEATGFSVAWDESEGKVTAVKNL